jgi:quercetin dioxygenase-like cupin family protein
MYVIVRGIPRRLYSFRDNLRQGVYPVRALTLLALATLSFSCAWPSGEVGPTTRAEFLSAELLVGPAAEKIVERLPPGPLFWRVEEMRSLAFARAAEGPSSLALEAWGKAWLVSLGTGGAAIQAGRKVAEIGPIPTFTAQRFRLRVNRASGPPGARTPVHTHPGSEAFLVLRGELSQRTGHGISRVKAGEVLNGHQPGMVMQLESTGAEPLEQLVMFIVDAEKPFSSPARF